MHLLRGWAGGLWGVVVKWGTSAKQGPPDAPRLADVPALRNSFLCISVTSDQPLAHACQYI